MYEAPVFTAEGKKAKGKALALPESIFDGTVHEAVMWQAAKAYLANQRKGNASTRNRSRVRGGSRKPWRQKGTGRARAGSTRSPLWRGGAITFGPQPRSYAKRLPKKVKALAIRSALNARAAEGDLVVVEPFALEKPKTKVVVKLLQGLGAGGRKVLILTDGVKPAVFLSGRNIPDVRILPWGDASAYDVLWSDLVMVEESALASVGSADAAEEEE